MSFLQRCLGFRNPTDVHDLLGIWERVGDDFEGCVIKVEQETNEWIGKIIISTPDMLEAGWVIGDKKWRHLERDTTGNWQLMDLRKQYDTAQKKVLSVDYAHYWISLSGRRKLRLHQSKVPLFPAQVWKRVG
ncbi:MAG: hypothetical protein K2W99_00860 [Chthoniobacterales bacterium]|nr:hypothetical protein [Chthoniobacterales bacterium]